MIMIKNLLAITGLIAICSASFVGGGVYVAYVIYTDCANQKHSADYTGFGIKCEVME